MFAPFALDPFIKHGIKPRPLLSNQNAPSMQPDKRIKAPSQQKVEGDIDDDEDDGKIFTEMSVRLIIIWRTLTQWRRRVY